MCESVTFSYWIWGIWTLYLYSFMLDLEKSVTESLVILEFPFHHSHLLQSNQFLLCTSVPVIMGERFSGRQGLSCIFLLNEELFRTPESSKSQKHSPATRGCHPKSKTRRWRARIFSSRPGTWWPSEINGASYQLDDEPNLYLKEMLGNHHFHSLKKWLAFGFQK